MHEVTAAGRRSSQQWIQFYGNGEARLQFDNTGDGPLLVPGFGHPISIERTPEERFAHGFGDWAQPRLTAREVAMLRFMNLVTDQPGWHIDISGGSRGERWRELALTQPLLSPMAWEWCLAELRDKAAMVEEQGLVHVFDSASRICKSDSLIEKSLIQELGSAVDRLANNLIAEEGQLHRLVDPSLYPLVYGRTHVLSDGGKVPLIGAINSMGKGSIASSQKVNRLDGMARRQNAAKVGRLWNESWEPRSDRFSFQFQWLPCEVAFNKVRGATKVKITSYINNLHPESHNDLYRIVESIISRSIEPWNQSLVRRDRGRTPERIRTHGAVWWPPYPEWMREPSPVETNPAVTNPPWSNCRVPEPVDPVDSDSAVYRTLLERARDYMQLPEHPNPHPRVQAEIIESDWQNENDIRKAVELKFRKLRHWLHPEPGLSFTYEQWKTGNVGTALIPEKPRNDNNHNLRPSKKNHQFYTISLHDMSLEQGLQVVVEIGSIDLTPDKPTWPGSDWGLNGLLNEHIVATSILYFGSTNVTPDSAALTFRVEADIDPNTHVFGVDPGCPAWHAFQPIADIYGVDPWEDLGCPAGMQNPGGKALQELGTVKTPDGRLVTYPNALQHKVEPATLMDLSMPGRRRYLVLHLVDPQYRICSTRNAPPQRHDWWMANVAATIPLARLGLPQELVARVRDMVGEWPMGVGEARRLRRERNEAYRECMQVVHRSVHSYQFADWGAQGGRVYFGRKPLTSA